MSEYTPTTAKVKAHYFLDNWWRADNADANSFYSEFDRWIAERDREVVLDERDRVTRILSDRSKFWSNESKREDINLKQREHCEDRAEILSNAIALIVWDDEEGNNV